jgi:hypothetical protein
VLFNYLRVTKGAKRLPNVFKGLCRRYLGVVKVLKDHEGVT